MPQYTIETINNNISMIDIELFGIKRVCAVFLIRGGLSCLVDSGTKKEAKGLIQALDSLGAFPPDIIILRDYNPLTLGSYSRCSLTSQRGWKARKTNYSYGV
jgi:hypothetical protein